MERIKLKKSFPWLLPSEDKIKEDANDLAIEILSYRQEAIHLVHMKILYLLIA